MKKYSKAFSLVELIVVVSIISVVGFASVSNFWNFTDNNHLQEINSDFIKELNSLDRDVKLNKIFDYNLSLKSGNLYFLVSKNEQFSAYKTNLSLDNNTLSWTLSVSWRSSTWLIWTIDLSYINFANNSLDLDASSTYSYDFSNYPYFSINSSLSGTSINSLDLKYFYDKNYDLSTKQSQKVYLSAINTKQDKSWLSLASINIININNKKYIKTENWQIIDNVFIFFETWWKEISLNI